MTPPDPLARYRDRALRVAEEFGPGHHGVENLADAIAKLVHEFVAHDLEWAALAVEAAHQNLGLLLEPVTPPSARMDLHARMIELAESLRARGRGES